MKPTGMRAGAALLLATLMSAAGTTVTAQSTSPGDEQLDSALAAVELMNLAPAGILETCRPTTPAMDGMIAVAQCQYGEDTVLYARFDGESSLGAAYDAIASGSGLSPDTGTTCEDGPFEGEYTSADGGVAGRLVCQLGPEGYLALWTDSERLVLGVVLLAGEGSYGVLREHWLAALLDTAVTASESPAASSVPMVSPVPAASSG
ncbi:MAG TPA: hypothetical protein VJZ50_01430 [Candidatus Limnocylindrales bacterium]|nr:hypothetical protein [Candidatus Limnocylindrales bacterium]